MRFISIFNIAERKAGDTDLVNIFNAIEGSAIGTMAEDTIKGLFKDIDTGFKLLARLVMDGKTSINKVYDPTCGSRVIILTQANSQVNTRGLELLLNSKSKK